MYLNTVKERNKLVGRIRANIDVAFIEVLSGSQLQSWAALQVTGAC